MGSLWISSKSSSLDHGGSIPISVHIHPNPLSSHETPVHLDSVWQPSQQFHPQCALHQHIAKAVMIKSILATWAPTIQSSANHENRNMEIPNIFARDKPSIHLAIKKYIMDHCITIKYLKTQSSQPPPPRVFLSGSSGISKKITPLEVDASFTQLGNPNSGKTPTQRQLSLRFLKV